MQCNDNAMQANAAAYLRTETCTSREADKRRTDQPDKFKLARKKRGVNSSAMMIGTPRSRCYTYGGVLAMWWLHVAAMAVMPADRFALAVVDAFALRQPPPAPTSTLLLRVWTARSSPSPWTRHDHRHGLAVCTDRWNGRIWRLAAEADDNVDTNTDTNTSEEQEEETTPTKIDSIIRDLHESNLPFRIVVIGNGAILETTSTLGPHMAESTSPKTGERLITLASDDRSFEFHLKPDTIAKVVFAESKKPDSGKTLRIVRMLRDDGGPICSLICADGSEDAISWYKTMTIRYGYEVHSGE